MLTAALYFIAWLVAVFLILRFFAINPPEDQ